MAVAKFLLFNSSPICLLYVTLRLPGERRGRDHLRLSMANGKWQHQRKKRKAKGMQRMRCLPFALAQRGKEQEEVEERKKEKKTQLTQLGVLQGCRMSQVDAAQVNQSKRATCPLCWVKADRQRREKHCSHYTHFLGQRQSRLAVYSSHLPSLSLTHCEGNEAKGKASIKLCLPCLIAAVAGAKFHCSLNQGKEGSKKISFPLFSPFR